MPTTDILEWDDTDGRPRPSRAVRLSRLMVLAVLAYFFAYPALWAQTSDSQTSDADKSWTATTESQSDNVNPTRTTESHTPDRQSHPGQQIRPESRA
jgi:hypothetical protein